MEERRDVLLLTLSSGHGGDTAADEAAGDAAVVVLESSSSFSSEAAELPSLRLLFSDHRCVDAVAVAEHIADCRSRGSLMTAKNSVSAGTMFHSASTTSLTQRVRKVSGGAGGSALNSFPLSPSPAQKT